MTNVFAVIGQHRDLPDRLLLLGEDNRLYAWSADMSDPVETEPSADWTIDESAPVTLPAFAP
jgi:hypothetical protein